MIVVLLEDFFRDIRFGLRRLIQTPAFTIVAVLTLGLGIGANTAIFTFVNKMLVRPLPVNEPDRIVALSNSVNDGRMFPVFSYLNYRDLRDRTTAVAELFAYTPSPISLSHDGVNERVWGYIVSGNYFSALGLQPAAGRLISAEDDLKPGGHPVTVISFDSWKRRFGGTIDAIGRNVVVNGRQFTIIGVAPPEFVGVEVAFTAELWFPIMMQSEISPRSRWQDRRGFENLYVAGKLQRGVTAASARSALRISAADLAREYPNENQGKTIEITAVGLFGTMGRGLMIGVSGILLAVTGLVLLLVCTNVANLCLARAGHRQLEVAVQKALGAGRGRLIRQLLTESVILAMAGGIAALLLASWLTRAASRFRLPVDIPISYALEMDWRVVLFTFGLSLLTGLVFGIVPAWQSTSGGTLSLAPRQSRLRTFLVAAQVSISFALMCCAGLTLRSLQKAEYVDLGMNPDHAIELGFDLDLQNYSRERGVQFVSDLLSRVRSLQGVTAAGVGSGVPPDPHMAGVSFRVEGAPAPERGNAPRSVFAMVSPGYRQALGIPLTAGRDFTDNDTAASQPVALVNETFARRFWNEENAIGKRMGLGEAGDWIEVVGIIGDGKYRSLGEDPTAFMIVPIQQRYGGLMKIVVRSDAGSANPIELVRREVHALDPNMPVFDTQTLNDHLRLPLFPARIAATMFGTFGSLALVLAAVGIFGVVSFTVSRRTHEIGIRIALGADRRNVLALIIRQGMMPVVIGLGVGLVGTLVLAPLIQIDEVLYGVSSTDSLTFGVITALLAAVSLIACYLPARRALRVDPVTALRHI